MCSSGSQRYNSHPVHFFDWVSDYQWDYRAVDHLEMESESVVRQNPRRKNTYLKSTSAVRVVNSRFGPKLKSTEVISLFVNSDYRDQSPELPVTEVSSASDWRNLVGHSHNPFKLSIGQQIELDRISSKPGSSWLSQDEKVDFWRRLYRCVTNQIFH